MAAPATKLIRKSVLMIQIGDVKKWSSKKMGTLKGFSVLHCS